MLPDLHGEHFSELIRGIDLAARARGLYLLVSSSHGDAAEAAAALRAMSGRVDGLLVMSPHVSADFLWGNVANDVPAVLMTRMWPAAGIRRSRSTTAAAPTQWFATSSSGAIATSPSSPGQKATSRHRLRGYRAAIAELLPATFEHVLQGDFTQESGFRAGSQVVALTRRPSAVFASNDMMAIGCLSALNEADVLVPNDIALAGFDDIPISRYVNPSLTTVRARITELGGLELERLASAIEEPDRIAPLHQTLRADLIVRQSTAGPAPLASTGGTGNASGSALANTTDSSSRDVAPLR